MKRKIIACVDGSYADGKGGWSFLYYYRQSPRKYRVVYGNCPVKNNVQMEIISCIKFLINIVSGKKLHSVEIRTDYNTIAKFFEDKCFERLDNGQKSEIPVGSIRQAISEWYKLYCVAENLKCKVKFSIADRTHKRMRIVHKYAKMAMHTDYNKGICWLKELKAEEFTAIYDRDDEVFDDVPNVWWETMSSKKWFEEQPVTILPIKEVMLVETEHLKADYLELSGYVAQTYSTKLLEIPIAVRKLPEGNYALVVGFFRYCIGKICDLEMIPAVITEMEYKDFKYKYGL